MKNTKTLVDETVQETKGDSVNVVLKALANMNEYTRDYLKRKDVGRNSSCFCGSGRKYKHCCLPKLK